jgi:hypothetical protein
MARLLIDGHFEVILCSCQFDNFYYIDYKHNLSKQLSTNLKHYSYL